MRLKLIISPKLRKQAKALGKGAPIYVFIYDNRWDAASPRVPPTWRDRRLFDLLKAMGGVSETKEGAWLFNVKQHRFFSTVSLKETDPPVPS